MSAYGSAAQEVVERSRRIQFLSRVGVFQLLSPLLLDDVAKLLQPRTVAAGEVVIAEGAVGDALYLVDLGTLAVQSRGRTVARLGPGEFFGEIALLTGGPRVASVQAETACELWVLGGADFTRLIEHHPGLATAVRRAGALRQQELAQREYDVERVNLATLLQTQQQLTMGRSPENDIVLPSRVVSGLHAVVRRFGDSFVLEDLGSSNGTYVNGAEVRRAELKDGDQIWIADQRLVFDRREMVQVIEPKGIRIDALGVRKEVKGGKNLLQDIHLTILPGEFVCIVGGSGAGKSTLMDALSGVRPATGGQVLYNAEEFYSRRSLYTHTLGYVPQDDIIHRELPLRVTMDYAARLRLPPDTSAAERAAVVDKAIAQLNLTEQRDIPVERLSGGQRKRCSIGVELLTEPRVFFLDEPTSGLDPAADTAMMKLMRQLTELGSTVVLTTHATKNVVLADKVVFLAKGGYLAYMGPPRGALEYFGCTEFDEIYDLLATGTPAEWAERFRATDDYQRIIHGRQALTAGLSATGPVQVPRRRGGLGRALRQFTVLSSRNTQTYLRNKAALMPLLTQPFILVALVLALINSGAFDTDPVPENPSAAGVLLFLYLFLGFTFGLLYGIQIIAREFPIFRRERLVGQGVVPYVLSKLTFLLPLITLSSTIMLVILAVTGRFPSDCPGGCGAEGDGNVIIDFYAPLLITMILCAAGGLCLALLTSAFANSPTQATDLLSLWIMPQVLFGGALIAVSAMPTIGQWLSHITVARPAFAAAGDATNINQLFEAVVADANASGDQIAAATATSLLDQYDGFFVDIYRQWAILAIFIVVPLVLACLVLRRKTRIR